VLVLDLEDGADACLNIEVQAISLAPAKVAAIAKAKPLTGKVSRASKVGEVLVNPAFIANALPPAASVSAGPG
jgi:hypothetical protein